MTASLSVASPSQLHASFCMELLRSHTRLQRLEEFVGRQKGDEDFAAPDLKISTARDMVCVLYATPDGEEIHSPPVGGLLQHSCATSYQPSAVSKQQTKIGGTLKICSG
jgi:hypothetical protein